MLEWYKDEERRPLVPRSVVADEPFRQPNDVETGLQGWAVLSCLGHVDHKPTNRSRRIVVEVPDEE